MPCDARLEWLDGRAAELRLAAIVAPGAAAAADDRVAGQWAVGFKPSARRGPREVEARLVKTQGFRKSARRGAQIVSAEH